VIILSILPFLFYGIKTALRQRSTLLSPLNLFCVWFLFLFGLYEPFTAIFNATFSPRLPFILMLGSVSTLAGLLVLPRIALLNKAPRLIADARQMRIAKRVAIAFALYCVLLSGARLHNSNAENVGDLYNFASAETTEEVAGPATLYDRINKLLTKPLLYMYLVSLGFLATGSDKERIQYIVLPTGLFTFSTLTEYNGRGAVVLFLGITLLLWSRISPRGEIRRLTIMGGIGIFAFFLLQPLRQGKLAEGGFSHKDFMESIGTGGEWEVTVCISDLIKEQNVLNLNEAALKTGNEIYYWVANWIPRVFWNNKPQTDFAARTSMEMYGASYAREAWVRNFTFVGQGYYIANDFGVIIVGFILGVSVVAALKLASNGCGWQGIYAYLLYISVYLSRDCLTTWLFDACSTLIFAYLINRFLFSSHPAARWQKARLHHGRNTQLARVGVMR